MASLRISLRAGERIFVNGAVLKFDRKTHLEFLNDVTFLLESHVMQADQAATPLRQLYFTIQMMLIDPTSVAQARRMFDDSIVALMRVFANAEIRGGLQDIDDLIRRDRAFEALKRLRGIIPLEDEILGEEAARSGSSRRKEAIGHAPTRSAAKLMETVS